MKLLFRCLAIALAFVYITSCKPVPVSHWFPVTPQEHYEQELYKAKQEKTVAGQTWFRVSKQVLSDTLFSLAPYQERFFLGDSTPAQSIRLKIPQGRKLVITPSKNDEDWSALRFKKVDFIKTMKRSSVHALSEKGKIKATQVDNSDSENL